MQLEDGEINDESDDDINPYIPLERPPMLNPACVAKPVIDADEDDEDNNEPVKKKGVINASSGSESDDEYVSGKRMKISRPTKSKSNKYHIWSKDPDDFLTDVLDRFGMEETPENDRNVENYLVRNWKPNAPRKRKIPKGAKDDVLHPSAQSKQLEPLSVTEENTCEEIASDIAVKLDEPNRPLILRIVQTLGKVKAIELFEATKEIEGDGGMLILSGNRKRTSGGIFIFLVREDRDITGVQREEIFEINKGDNFPKTKKKKRNKKDKTKLVKDQLSNPPPSPDPEADLPDLPHRRDIVMYDEGLF
ncbi:phosphorylated adapter RNA export protein-like [Cimex lectularius]|uniref:Phosphorylated adapter RNA export protein n=1 Tax=Cimex lectularius TaxID=79782 RepID=A0A8I6RBE4_CIMLE|nr:phosphorylated adapter RNA export protein-like [Cimex lectularius]